jgi:hypothetical protein
MVGITSVVRSRFVRLLLYVICVVRALVWVTRGRLTIWLLAMLIARWLLLMVRVIVGVAIARCKDSVRKSG